MKLKSKLIVSTLLMALVARDYIFQTRIEELNNSVLRINNQIMNIELFDKNRLKFILKEALDNIFIKPE